MRRKVDVFWFEGGDVVEVCQKKKRNEVDYSEVGEVEGKQVRKGERY